ncbi:hypothetical protein I4U23_023288 [Adineta vaga]|nr:hypothetical protein I4U23_023288 [Adineta vaga]
MSVASNETIFDDDGDSTSSSLETPFSRSVKFTFLLICQVASVLCSLIIFSSFARLRELQAKQHNHVVICLLICNFLIVTIELPVTLTYLHFDQLVPASNGLCFYWIFTNYFLFTSSLWVMAIASIQRYILIFHAHIMNSHLKHYTPIILPTLFLFIWYVVLIFFYSCEQQFDYTQLWCIGPCFAFQGTMGTIDWILSSFIPVVLTVIFNILLILRVVYQKYRIQHGRTWRTTRKLALQLFSISFLFLSIYLPLIIISLVRIWFDPYFLLLFGVLYMAYSVYLVPLLMPFICLISLPEIVLRMKKLCCCGFNNRVEAIGHRHIPMTVTSRRANQEPRRMNIV